MRRRGERAECYAVIAGGGTAGHVVPGLAIAAALVDRGIPREQIHYVGSARGIERTMVPDAGFALTLLPGRGIQRRLSKANLGAVAGLARACGRALALVGRLRPQVVVALGGYASVPAALGAIAWRVPIVVAEQNAVPGAANRVVGRFARACAVSFENTPLPRAVLTGNPVRAAVLDVERKPIEPPTVLAFGGSLGARRINEAVLGLAETWRDRAGVAIYHVIGERDWAQFAPRVEALAAGPAPRYRAVAYEHDLPARYATAALAVCRAGASTVAELAAVGLPAVLVPLPGAPGDHQTANARAAARAGGAVMLADEDCTAAALASAVGELLANRERLTEMSAAARAAGRPDAAARVAELVMAHARLAR